MEQAWPFEQGKGCERAPKGMAGQDSFMGVCLKVLFYDWNQLVLDEVEKIACASR